MASTVDQVITKFKRRFRDCEASYALTLFQEAHRRILKKTEVRNTTRAISLTALTRQYDLDASVYKIHEVYYERSSSASDWKVLTETSIDRLIELSKGWRTTSSQSEPFWYYITSATSGDSAKNQIGFEPVPTVSTSGTYPRVVLYTTEYADLSGSETVPENLLDDDVYTDIMSEMYCKDARGRLEQYEFYQKAAAQSLEANSQHVQNLQLHTADFEIITPFIDAGRVF